VVVLALVLGGGGGDGEGGPRDEGSGAKTSAKSDPGRDAKIEAYRDRAASAQLPEELVAVGEEAEALGLEDEARRHFLEAIELDPECEPARRKLGHVRYALPPEAADYPPDLVKDLHDLSGTWLAPAEREEIEAKEAKVLARARAELEKRKRDPFHAHVARILNDLESVEGFKDYQFVHRRSDPYLIVEHAGRKGFNPYRSDEAKAQLALKVKALKKVFRYVVDNFIRPAGLKRDKTRPLVVVSFEDRDVFEEYNASVDMPIPPGALAYFHRQSKYIIMYNGPTGQFNQEASDSTLFHEATHQIFDAFCNPDGGFDTVLSLWFNEGMAEYVGSLRLKPAPGGTFEHLIAYEMKSGRLAEFYAARFPKKFQQRRMFGLEKPYFLSLQEMVTTFHAGQNIAQVVTKWVRAGGMDPRSASPGQRDQILAIAGSLIYAEASSFMFFCFKGKPGKYKDKMMEYLKRELTGRRIIRNAQTFREIFGDDLEAIEKEWLDYVDSQTTMGIKEGKMY